MKIHVDRPVLTIGGKEFEPPTTLRAALFNALTSSVPGDERLPMDEKLKLHRLAVLMHSQGQDTGVLELSVEQIAEIKKRAAVCYPNHFFGQVNAMLEDNATAPAIAPPAKTDAELMDEYHGRYAGPAKRPSGGIPA